MNAFSVSIDHLVEDVRRHFLIPGIAVAVVQNGHAVHVAAYGQRSIASLTPADIDTAFAIGSCSKAFTSALAAALVDDGKLRWDDRVRTYLPAFQLHDPWISDHLTIRDLLANRTGLSRASVGEYGSDLTRSDLLRRARFVPPICDFRDQFAYCNIGFAAAAEALAELSGTAFDRLMDDHVLKAQKMTACSTGTPLSLKDNIAAPHYIVDGATRTIPPIAVDNLLGALGLTLSARDAARWLAFHLDEHARDSAIGETHLLQIVGRNRIFDEGYGLGWYVRNRRIQHEGSQRGFRANIWCNLEDRTGIFVAMNLGSGKAHFAITNHIIQLSRGETPVDWIAEIEQIGQRERSDRMMLFDRERRDAPISASTLGLEDFIGTFWHQGFGTLRIDSRGDHLWFHIDDLSGFDGPLMRYSAMSFEYQGDRDAMAWPPLAIPTEPRGDRARIRFRSTNGVIESLEWSDWFGTAQFVRSS